MKNRSRKPISLLVLLFWAVSLGCMISGPISPLDTPVPTATEEISATETLKKPLAATETSITAEPPTEIVIPNTPTVRPTPIPLDFRITDFRKKSFILVLDPSTPNTVYAKSEDAAYLSIDGANTWSRLDDKAIASLPVAIHNRIFEYDIARRTIDPSSPAIWYDVFQHVLKRSVDNGQTWQEISNQSWMTGIDALIAVDPFNSQTLFWGIWDGLYRSGDGGLTWNKVLPGSASEMNVSVFSMIVFDPISPNIIYIIDDATGLYKSIDNGITWKPLSSSHFLNQWLVINPAEPKNLYAKDYNQTVYLSVDGGETWKSINLGLPANDVRWFVIDPSNPANHYAILNQAENSGLFKSTDNGQTWVEIPAALLP